MRYVRVAVLLFGALVGRAVHAQGVGEVRGKVVDQNGHAVENAQIELLPGSRRATTLDDGGFAITNVRQGVYVLSARRVGYEPTDVNVAVRDSSVTFTVTLVAIPTQLEAIHVREKSQGIQYSGVVLDQFDVPVTGAEVVAIGINSQLKTDGMGRFTVPKLAQGTLTLRIRKIGYSAYFESYRILAERADTIRLSRLAASLTPVEIRERSGFGTDEWAYKDLDQRTRWKGTTAGSISHEELAQQGRANLCEVIHHAGDASRFGLISEDTCNRNFFRVLIDGSNCQTRKLTDFNADQVDLIEYFPRPVNTKIMFINSDPSGNLEARRCPPAVFVIWLHHDTPGVTPTRVMADEAKLALDTAAQQLAPVEIRAAGPIPDAAHLQGQVVDSTNHPIRSALVYTQDPLYATLSDKNGYFRFRELPPGPITVRAEHNGFVPIEFQLRLPPDSTVGIGLKLLRAAAQIGTMEIDSSGSGGRMVRVLSERGQPIMYANVTLDGATVRITDEKGELNLGLGARQKVSVRVARIGFAPWFGVVDLPAGATMTITLPQIAQLLAAVTVASGATGGPQVKASLPLAGFYDRWMQRQNGALTGVFFGPEEIEFRRPVKVTRMLAGLNGIRLICDMSGDCRIQSTNPGGILPGTSCPLAVVLDGKQIYGDVNVDALINVNDVMAIEVYERGGNIPIGLQVNDTKCGVVAFWTGSRK
jgi:hypothetical protein